MNFNPVLSEIQGLSPEAQGALGMAGHALSQGAAAAAPPMVGAGSAPPQITPQVKAAAMPQDAGPAPAISPMRMADSNPVPSLGAPVEPNIHVLGSSPLGTLQGDKDELQRRLSTGSGESQISSRIQGTQFGQNHPMLGKILGGVAQSAATLGDIGLSTVAPQVAINLPGTAYHHQMLVNEGNHQVAADEANTEKEAQTRNLGAETAAKQEETTEAPQKANDTHELSQASAGNLTSETDERDNPHAQYEVHDTQAGPLFLNKTTGQAQHLSVNGMPVGPKIQTKVVQLQIGGKDHQVLVNDTDGTVIKDMGQGGIKPPSVSVNQGTWQMQEDAQGKPMEFNSKTGATRAAPEGMQKAGTFAKAEAAKAPVQGALDYATDYLNKKAYTGPGDEALQEKFFELAKPSTGFRMSQPQMDMLRNSASWMNSIEGKAHHLTTGTWFSDEQRGQIVNTMNDLARAKGLKPTGSGGSSQASAVQSSGLAVSLADARQLPQNKGKSDADITADIKAHGHEVKP